MGPSYDESGQAMPASEGAQSGRSIAMPIVGVAEAEQRVETWTSLEHDERLAHLLSRASAAGHSAEPIPWP